MLKLLKALAFCAAVSVAGGAVIEGTIVNSPITLGSDAAVTGITNKHIGDTSEMKGTPKSVTSILARNEIAAARRQEGMYVWVTTNSTMYQLVGGIVNANWKIAALTPDSVLYWGAITNTESTEVIQAALDAAGNAGGGIVRIPRGVFMVTNTLLVPSGVRVLGEGIGSTIMRAGPVTNFLGKVVGGLYHYAVFSMSAVTNASVENLTVDLASFNVGANGIQVRAAPAEVQSVNCSVIGCEVLAPQQIHYSIWNQKSRGTRVLNNIVTGQFTTSDPLLSQDGIESYGGQDVLIEGNTVRHIAGNCIYVNSEGDYSDREAIRIVNNHTTGGQSGIYITAGTPPTGAAARHVHVQNNAVFGSFVSGLKLALADDSVVHDIQFANNSVANCPTGIELNGKHSAILSAIAVAGNSITNCTTGIMTVNMPCGTISDNSVTGCLDEGIFLNASSSILAIGNTVDVVGLHGLWANNVTNVLLRDNVVRRWNGSNASASAILVNAGQWMEISGNSIHLPVNETYAIDVASGSSYITLQNNSTLYVPTVAPAFRNSSTYPIPQLARGELARSKILIAPSYLGYGLSPNAPLEVRDSATNVAVIINTNQWVVTNGNTGIGTSTPGSKLDVMATSADFSGVTTVLKLRGSANSGDDGQAIEFLNGLDGSQKAFKIHTLLKANDKADLVFSRGNAADGYTPSVVFDENGYVGIGITDPTRALHVYRNDSLVQASVMLEQNGSGDANILFLNTGVGNWNLGVDASDGRTFKISTDDGFAAGPHFNITTNGYVGIGKTTPSVKLELYNTAAPASGVTTVLKIDGTANAGDDGNAIEFLSGNGTQKAAKIHTLLKANDKADLVFSRGDAADGYTPSVVFDKDGNVGIGTATPVGKLDVTGSIHTILTNKSVLATDSNGFVIEGAGGSGGATNGIQQLDGVGTNTQFYSTAYNAGTQVYDTETGFFYSADDHSLRMDLEEGELFHGGSVRLHWGNRALNGDWSADSNFTVAGTFAASGSATVADTVYADAGYFTNDCSALTFTDRSKAPSSLKDAWEIVSSMKTKDGHVDHGALSPKAYGTRIRTVTNTAPRFVKGIRQAQAKLGTVTEPDQTKRDLGMVVSAQAMVIQDLLKRLEKLEKK